MSAAFTVLALGAMIVAKYRRELSHAGDEALTLRIAIPHALSMEDFDTAHLNVAPAYILLQGMYSPLVEYDNDMQLVAGAAESFVWEGERLVVKLRRNLKTVDGWTIDAHDVAATLIRQMILGTNTHGDIRALLCPGFSPKSITDSCPGIEVVDKHTVIFSPVSQREFLLSMLVSIDFAIIPRQALDPKTLKIRDYRNTSGPYYFEGKDQDGHLVLKRNAGHWHGSYPRQADRIVVIHDDVIEGIQPLSYALFKQGLVDQIPTTNTYSIGVLAELAQLPKVEVHATEPMRISFLLFTPRGRKLPVDVRQKLVRRVRKAIAEMPDKMPPYAVPAPQYYPRHGSLIGKLAEKYEEELRGDDHFSWEEPIKVAVHPSQYLIKPWIDRALPGVVYVPNDRRDYLEKSADDPSEPHLVFLAKDVSFSEEVAEIGYSLKSGKFPLLGKEADAWLVRFVAEPDSVKRYEMLQQLHYDTIMGNPSMIPLYRRSYLGLAQNGWKMHLSRFSALNEFWLIRKEL